MSVDVVMMCGGFVFCAPFSSARFVVSSRCVFSFFRFVVVGFPFFFSFFRFVVSFRLISFCCCVSFCRTDVRVVFCCVVSNCCSVSFLCGVAFRFVELAFVLLCGVVSYCLFVCRVVSFLCVVLNCYSVLLCGVVLYCLFVATLCFIELMFVSFLFCFRFRCVELMFVL